MASFNLVYEPWIPCQMVGDGSTVELSLRDTLCRSHQIKEIRDPSPLVTVSLHRLLLAILHRIVGPASLAEWQALWQKGAWDTDALTAYFDRYAERFDLFHPEMPFYQVSSMADAEEKPIAYLAQEMASGNNATLFDHSFEENATSVPPSLAVRYLLARQSFSIGFGRSKPFYFADSPMTRGHTILANGENLFESLALNLVAYNEQRPIPRMGSDPPVWEQSFIDIDSPDPHGTPLRGYLHYLTWQSRRIHLIPNQDGLSVIGCQVQQNLKFSSEPPDPFKTYRKSQQEGWTPVGISPQRAVWRDSHALFQKTSPERRRSDVLDWLGRINNLRIQGSIIAKASYEFSVYGFATERGKAASVVIWRHERLPLPLAYLREDNDLVGKLGDGLALAENVGKLFQPGFDSGTINGKKVSYPRPFQLLAASLLAPATGNPDQDAVRKLVKSLNPEAAYWPALEGPFKRFMVDLADQWPSYDPYADDAKTLPAERELVGQLKRVARNAFATATSSLDSSARTLKGLARAERAFNIRLRRILNAATETTEAEGETNAPNPL